MKKVLSLALGVFTAIGGFIDIGDLRSRMPIDHEGGSDRTGSLVG